MPPLTHQTIAERAYFLWVQSGRPTGRDEEFWLRAEAELVPVARASSAPSVTPPPVPATPPAASPAHEIPPGLTALKKTPDTRPRRKRAPKRT